MESSAVNWFSQTAGGEVTICSVAIPKCMQQIRARWSCQELWCGQGAVPLEEVSPVPPVPGSALPPPGPAPALPPGILLDSSRFPESPSVGSVTGNSSLLAVLLGGFCRALAIQESLVSRER